MQPPDHPIHHVPLAAAITMSINRHALFVLPAVGLVLFGGCASLQGREPVQVIIAGVEPLHGEGLELRMLVKLRVQNPNDLPLDYNGVAVRIDVQGKPFATGVSDEAGSVPRFGETLITVPVTVSAFSVARLLLGLTDAQSRGEVPYTVSGKLAGGGSIHGSFRVEEYRAPQFQVDVTAPSRRMVPPPAGRKVRLAAVHFRPQGGKSPADNCRQFDKTYMAPLESSIRAAALALERMGAQQMKAKNYDAALKTYRQLAAADPKRGLAYANMGYIHSTKGQTDKAIESYRSAVKVDREDEGAWLGLGEAYEKKKMYKEALEAYKAAYQINPESRAAERIPQLRIRMLEDKHKE